MNPDSPSSRQDAGETPESRVSAASGRCRRCQAHLLQRVGPPLCAACALELVLTFEAGDESDAATATNEPDGDAAVAVAAEQRFGDYLLVNMLAVGGMGTVWEARQVGLGRPVALKMLRSGRFASALEIQRFHLEAGAAARLSHPHIVPVYEVGEHDGQQFFSMQLVTGADLAHVLAQGAMDSRRAAQLIAKVARAVAYAHRHGVLHRDLKPANIVLDAEDEPHLTDFGLAKASWADSKQTHTADLLGTPHYMSPEQASGNPQGVSTAADIWSLGVILFEALAGAPPFAGSNWMETLRRVAEEEAPRLLSLRAGLDADIEAICEKCLEKEPTNRYATADDLADDLDRWLAGEPIRARVISPGQRLGKWMKRHPWAMGVSLASVVALGIFLTVTTLQWRQALRMNQELRDGEGRLRAALRLATARQLAAQARVELNTSPSLALLLAVESAESTRRADGTVDPAAFNALVAVLQEVGGAPADPMAREPAPLDLSSKLRAVSALSPDGRWLAVAGPDGGVRLFEGFPPFSREPRCVLMLERSHTLAVAWSSDARSLFTIGSTGDIRRWDFDVQLNSASIPPGRTIDVGNTVLMRLPHGVACAAFVTGVPGGIAWAVTATHEGEVRLWPVGDVGAERARPSVAIHAKLPVTNLEGRIGGLVVSPDGRWLALRLNATDQEILALSRLDLASGDTGSLAARWVEVGGNFIRDLAFSPDGGWLAVARADGQGYLVDLREGDPAGTAFRFTAHAGEVRDVAFSADNRWVASVGFDGQLRLREMGKLRSGAPAVVYHHDRDRSYGVTFSPDNRWVCLLRSDGAVDAWELGSSPDLAPQLRLRGPEFAEGELAFAPDGRTLWAIDLFGSAWRWAFDGTSATASPRTSPRLGGPVRSVAYSRGGQWLAAAAEDGRVRVWEGDLKRMITLTGHDEATAVGFSHDDRWLATIGKEGKVRVWELRALQACLNRGESLLNDPRHVLPTGGTRTLFARKLAWHPHGWLYATSGDGLLFDWDFTQPDPARTVRSHRMHSIDYMLNAVAVSPDGRWLAVGRHGWDDRPVTGSAQYGNQVLLHDVTDPSRPQFRWALRCGHLAWGALAFSPDSRWLACGAEGKSALVWDVHEAEPARTVREAPFTAQVLEALAFSPDGRTLALGGWDGRLHLWSFLDRAGSSRSLRLPQGLRSCSFTSDGQRLATGGFDGRVRIWDLDLDVLIEGARRTAGREFTRAERERFELPDRAVGGTSGQEF